MVKQQGYVTQKIVYETKQYDLLQTYRKQCWWCLAGKKETTLLKTPGRCKSRTSVEVDCKISFK